ncbi:MAG: ribonuclease J, partial [Myxococcales bacterium]
VGDEGVRLLLSDSTNVDSIGWSGSEEHAATVLRNLIETAPARVVVGLFASNVARLQTVGEIAASLGRKVVLLGRSVLTHARIGQQLGHLKWPSDLLLPVEAIASTPKHKIVGIATGTQGERLAALAKLASRTHPHLQLDEGDRVIFSSRVIPGNEPVLSQMMNGLLRHGIQVCTATTDPGVHVSGHAYRDEQSRMIELTRPQSFVPIHGTLMHLHRHAALARERGVSEVTVLENGEVGELADDRALGRARGWVAAGKVATWGGDDIPERVLQDREQLARSGIVLVTAVIDSRGRPVGSVSLATRGVIDERLDGDVLRETAREAQRLMSEHPYHHHRPGDDEVAEVARSAVRRKLEASIGRRPMVLAQVVRAR